LFAFVGFRQSESFAIPTDASGKIPYRGSAEHFGIVGLLNAPVMRHIEYAPLRVVETRGFSARSLTQMK
jgi:hypothetical protein